MVNLSMMSVQIKIIALESLFLKSCELCTNPIPIKPIVRDRALALDLFKYKYEFIAESKGCFLIPFKSENCF